MYMESVVSFVSCVVYMYQFARRRRSCLYRHQWTSSSSLAKQLAVFFYLVGIVTIVGMLVILCSVEGMTSVTGEACRRQVFCVGLDLQSDYAPSLELVCAI